MSDCHAFRDELDDVAVGEAARGELRAHLESCTACASALERKRALIARIDSAAKELVAAVPAASFVEPVLARVRAEGSQSYRRAFDIGSRAWWLSGAVVAAAVAAFGVFEEIRHAPISAVPTASAVSVAQWRSPTSLLLQPSVSVLDIRSRGRLLDIGENHAR